MRLKISDRSEDPSYYAIESVRKGKKTTSKVVMRFGKRSDLLKEHSDPSPSSRERSRG